MVDNDLVDNDLVDNDLEEEEISSYEMMKALYKNLSSSEIFDFDLDDNQREIEAVLRRSWGPDFVDLLTEKWCIMAKTLRGYNPPLWHALIYFLVAKGHWKKSCCAGIFDDFSVYVFDIDKLLEVPKTVLDADPIWGIELHEKDDDYDDNYLEEDVCFEVAVTRWGHKCPSVFNRPGLATTALAGLSNLDDYANGSLTGANAMVLCRELDQDDAVYWSRLYSSASHELLLLSLSDRYCFIRNDKEYDVRDVQTSGLYGLRRYKDGTLGLPCDKIFILARSILNN